MGKAMKPEKEFQDVSIILHDKVLMFRCLEHYLTTEECENTFVRASDDERAKMRQWIVEGNYKALKEWITANKNRYLPIENWSLEMLRNYASKHKIKNYGLVPKGMLIKMVKKEKEERGMK